MNNFCKEFLDMCNRAAADIGSHKNNGTKTYNSVVKYLKWKHEYQNEGDSYNRVPDHKVVTKERVAEIDSLEILTASRHQLTCRNIYFGKACAEVFDKVQEYLKNEKCSKKKKGKKGVHLKRPLEIIFFKACVHEQLISSELNNREYSVRKISEIFQRFGFSYKQLYYYLTKWSDRGFYNWGVNIELGWFEFEHLDKYEDYKKLYEEVLQQVKEKK